MVPGNPEGPSAGESLLTRWGGRFFGALRRRWAAPLRVEMQHCAARAPGILGKESGELVLRFVLNAQNADGGFRGRGDKSDLYYTMFALQSLRALRKTLPQELRRQALRAWLSGFENEGRLAGLDLVHLCAWVRCRALLEMRWDHRQALRLAQAVQERQDESAYTAFLTLGAHQDLRLPLPEATAAAMRASLRALARADGGFANAPGVELSATNATAAALAVLAHLGETGTLYSARRWLLERAHPLGGFCASPQAPMPDLLSTATALFTLRALRADLSGVREPSLQFLDSLWSNVGSFHGHWHDAAADVEYAFHGLLALGVLAQ